MTYEPWNTVGFDCSGLTLYAWAQVGVSLPHYSVYQFMSGQRLSRSELQPGDLVFFASNTSDPNTIHHVAIYMGKRPDDRGTPVRHAGADPSLARRWIHRRYSTGLLNAIHKESQACGNGFRKCP